jgi:hypothetical protein
MCDSGGIYRVAASEFFPNDLLYALENGPKQATVQVPSIGTLQGFSNPTATATIGGTLGPGISYALLCPDGGLTGAHGKCLPDSLEMSLSGLATGELRAVHPNGVALELRPRMREVADAFLSAIDGGTVPRGNAAIHCQVVGYEQLQGGQNTTIQSSAVINECGDLVITGAYIGGIYLPSRFNKYIEEPLLEQIAGYQITAYKVSAEVFVGENGISPYVVGGLLLTRATVEFFLSGSGWRSLTFEVVGEGSVSGNTSAGQPVYAAISAEPQSVGWPGGSYSYTYTSPTWGNGVSPQTISRTLQPRGDAIQADADVTLEVGLGSNTINSLAAIGSLTQGFRPCGIMGLSARFGTANLQGSSSYTTAPSGGIVGLIAATFEQGVPCDPPFTATTSNDWITVRLNDDDRSLCVEIAQNMTGQSRMGSITFSPVWVLNGVPSSSVNATLGTYNYAITQAG